MKQKCRKFLKVSRKGAKDKTKGAKKIFSAPSGFLCAFA